MDKLDYMRKEEERHIKELKTRISACSRDELSVICDTIARDHPDIIFDALLKEYLRKESLINRMRGELNE